MHFIRFKRYGRRFSCAVRKDNMGDGYIAVWRKVMHSLPWQEKNPWYFKVFMYCLLQASHNEHKVKRNKQEYTLLPGYFVYSRTEWSKKLGLPSSTLRNIHEYLILWDTIEVIVKDKGIPTICKVKNWDQYQNKDSIKDSIKTRKRTTQGQHEDTTNNDNNDNKGKPIPPKPPRGGEKPLGDEGDFSDEYLYGPAKRGERSIIKAY